MKNQTGHQFDHADTFDSEKKDQRGSEKKMTGDDPLKGIGAALLKSIVFWGISGLLMAAIYAGFHGLVSGYVFEPECATEANVLNENLQQNVEVQSTDVSQSADAKQDIETKSTDVLQSADAQQDVEVQSTDVSQSADAKQDIETKSTDVSQSADAKQDIETKSTDVSLIADAKQDIETESTAVSLSADMNQEDETQASGDWHASAALDADSTAISDTTQNKTVALTFDDGPHPIYTAELLDGLKERGVQATFFVIGENIPGNEELIARMEAEGHLIGNHTYDHVKISDMAVSDACSQVEKTSALVREITGHDTEFVRPPFGEWKTGMECSFVMLPVLWDVDPLDWTTSDTSLVVQRVISETEDQDIILLHDCYESSVQAALQIVDQLQAEGYEFVTADRLLLD